MPKCYNTWWHKEHKEFIPCGKCEACRKRIISAWSVRLLWQDRKSISSHFITLTYDDKTIPISRRGYSTLRKRDVQLFFKRLRKAQSKMGSGTKAPIRYFCVGEYGGKIGRPHYHIIIFNADVRHIQNAWSSKRVIINKVPAKRWSYGTIREGKEIYRTVKKVLWQHNGHVHYGDERGVNGASVGYCLKYILENKEDKTPPPDYDAQREFRLMSKGIGTAYLNKQNKQWHYDDIANRMYMQIEDKKFAMPRYFKDKIYDSYQKEIAKKQSSHRMVDKIFRDLVYYYKEDVIRMKEDTEQKRLAQRWRQRLLKIKNKKTIYA